MCHELSNDNLFNKISTQEIEILNKKSLSFFVSLTTHITYHIMQTLKIDE